MKTRILSGFIAFMCLAIMYPYQGAAQFGELGDKVINKAGTVLNKKTSNLLQSDPITTSFSDCDTKNVLLETFGNDSAKADLCKQSYIIGSGFKLTPGFYTGTFKSFCLKAGTYGPSKGDGYLYAPLKGSKQTIVSKIVSNWEKNQQIEQRKVQLLLWAIIAKTNFTKMSTDLQATAAQLLSAQDIASLSSNMLDYLPQNTLNKLLANMPQPVRTIVEVENKMRGIYYQAQSTYDQIENVAIIPGAAPKSSNDIARGLWSKLPSGAWVRYFPNSYTNVVVEVYVPAGYGEVWFQPLDEVATPANTAAQRLCISNILICQ